MAGRLSETERAELVARAERLRLELRLVEAELRSDAALRVRATGPGRGRAAPELSARSAYLRKLYGGR